MGFSDCIASSFPGLKSLTSGYGDFLKAIPTEETYRLFWKESIPRHVSSIDRETLRATVEHTVTHFEHMIDANVMHIEQIYD